MNSDRGAEIAARVEACQAAVTQAARAAGRSPQEVTIIGITKTFPASDARYLSTAGITNLGENKAQELSAKATACGGPPTIAWHFVGQLQRNKAKLVARTAQFVHSIDRASLVAALERHVAEDERPRLACLIQINLDPVPHPERGGIAPKDALDLAELVAQSPHLSLAGVMGVASHELPARECFERLADVRTSVMRNHPQATMMSAGMSADFPAAIAAGATHVRLGAALLGERSYLR